MEENSLSLSPELKWSGLVVIYCSIYCIWNLTIHQSHRAVTPFCCCTTQIKNVFQIIIFLINRKRQSVWMPTYFPNWKKPSLRRSSVLLLMAGAQRGCSGGITQDPLLIFIFPITSLCLAALMVHKITLTEI